MDHLPMLGELTRGGKAFLTAVDTTYHFLDPVHIRFVGLE